MQNSLILLNYGDDLYKQFQVQWFSFTGSSRKDRKSWHWKYCIMSFEKISDDIIRFMVRRKKTVLLPDNTKLRWDKKQESTSLKVNSFCLHYVIHFDVQISALPKRIDEEKIEEQLYNKDEYGDKKDSWVLNLDNRHKIWTWKDTNEDTKKIMIEILESIDKKRDSQAILLGINRRDSKINKNILPVVYHPSRDLRGVRNYIQEIHLNRSNTDKKILVTIVYNDEQLRENAWVDLIYRMIRKLLHGRSFDVESFSIVLDENGDATKFDFPDIYSGHDNKLEKDSIHCNKCDINVQSYFNQDISLPILFVNTSNHAMAEIDNNCDKWKIEYRLWEEQCPIYIGSNTRCEIERYLSKHAMRTLFRKCNDSNYFSCNEEK